MTNAITREELRSTLDSLTVVDALPPAPYGQRHLPGAINVVAEDSDEHVAGALPDKAAFLLLEGRGRWTRGEDVLELAPQDMLVVPPDTPIRRTAFATSGTCRCMSCPCTSAAPCARPGSAASLPRHDR